MWVSNELSTYIPKARHYGDYFFNNLGHCDVAQVCQGFTVIMASNAVAAPEPVAGPSDFDWYAVIDVLDGSKCDKEGMKEWIRQSEAKNLEILVTGRTGTGKSTLVNALVGKKVAEEGHGLRPKTTHVKKYMLATKDGLEILVWDSPGLQDGTVNEATYLTDMKEKCSNVDIVIYAVDVSKTRSALKESDQSFQSDYSAIQKLTHTFGVDWWKNAVFVLTFANKLEALLRTRFPLQVESKFKERVDEWKRRIRAALSEAGVPQKIAEQVAIEPAGYIRKPHLPGHDYWLSILWFTFLSRTKRQSQPILVKINAKRFVAVTDISPRTFTSKESYEQPIVVDKRTVAAATAMTIAGTSATAASIGTGIGLGIGAAVGAAGFGIGAVVGAAAGAVAGGAIGGAVGVLYYLYEKNKTNV